MSRLHHKYLTHADLIVRNLCESDDVAHPDPDELVTLTTTTLKAVIGAYIEDVLGVGPHELPECSPLAAGAT